MKEPRKEDYGFKDKMWPDYDSEKAFNDAFSEWHALHEDIHTVFDANTFGPDEVPVEQTIGFSTIVLVDLDGQRTSFIIGRYDFIERKWKFIDGVKRDSDNIRWSFLPLAIYDTNPELRKTVKL